MSDIPIGSPQAPPGRHAAPSGWYPDPTDPAQERWWDGWQWSRNVRPREGAPAPTPPPAPIPPTTGYPPAPPPGYGQSQYPPEPHGSAHYGSGPYGSAPYGSGQYGTPALRPVAYTADGVPLAGWWFRALAVVIDALIVSTVAVLLSIGVWQRVVERFVALVEETVRTGAQPAPGLFGGPQVITPSESLLLAGVQFAVGIAYHVLFLRFKAATPGKLATGLRVVPVDRGRATEQLGWATVIVRALVWLGPMLTGLLFLIRLVDVLLPLWQPKRQALHDLAARTQVIRTR